MESNNSTKITNENFKPVKIARGLILVIFVMVVTVLVTRSVWLNIRDNKGNKIAATAAKQYDELLQRKFDDMESAASGFQFLLKKDASTGSLTNYIYEKNDELFEQSDGECLSFYCSDGSWLIRKDTKYPLLGNLKERLWYSGAVQKNGRIYISAPYYDSDSNQMVYSMSKMLYDGKTVVVMNYSLMGLDNIIKEATSKYGGKAYIMDENGMIYACTDSDKIGMFSKNLEEEYDVISKIFAVPGNSIDNKSSDRQYITFSEKCENDAIFILYMPVNLDALIKCQNAISIFIPLIIVVLFIIGLTLNIRNILRYLNNSDETVDILEIMRFRQTLYLSMLVLIFIALSVVFIFSGVTSELRYERQIMVNRAEDISDTVTEWSSQVKQTLQLVNRTVEDYQNIENNSDKIAKEIKEIVGATDGISRAYVYNPSWDVAYIGNDGVHVRTQVPAQINDIYSGVLTDNGEIHISEPYIGARNVYCITIGRAILDENNSLKYIICADCYVDKLEQILSEYTYKNGTYAFVTNNTTYILNHPSEEFSLTVERIVRAVDTEYSKLFSTDDTVIIRDFDGKLKTGISVVNEETGFFVVYVTNAHSVFGRVLRTLFIYLTGTVIGIIMTMLIVISLNRWQATNSERLKNEAQKAEQASKAKSDFLANMSHEIRTPINAIMGMDEMILRECNDGTIKGYANDINSAARTLLNIINDILDTSKIESGRMEIIPTVYEVVPFIHDLNNIIDKRAKDKGIKFTIEADKEIPAKLLGDDIRIKQVITNLLTNAVKYTEKGSVTLAIGGAVEGDKFRLKVSVADTGIGIKQEDIHRLFNAFDRIEEKRNRNIEGTGLGINITKDLLNLMDSSLKVESEYGKGSKFSFEILQGIESKEVIGTFNVEENTKKANNKIEFTAEGVKVLVVDDNAINRKVFKALLKNTKMEIDEVDSGIKAVEITREKQYDIIFLDDMMPEMDGREAFKIMKADESNLCRNIPIIMLTANAIVGAKEEYLLQGFDDFLSKPVFADKLEKMIIKHIPNERIVMNK